MNDKSFNLEETKDGFVKKMVFLLSLYYLLIKDWSKYSCYLRTTRCIDHFYLLYMFCAHVNRQLLHVTLNLLEKIQRRLCKMS